MGVLDIFKRKQKEIDLPPPPPPEILENQELPQDLELPPLPELPPAEDSIPEPKSYEIPSLETEEFPLPPIEVMPKPELQVKPNEPQQTPAPETVPGKEAPIFVKLDEYRDILENINSVKEKIKESDYVIEALGDLRTKIDAEFEKWREDLEEMQRKLLYIDKIVFEDKSRQ